MIYKTLKTFDSSQVTTYKTLKTLDLWQVTTYKTLKTFDLSQATNYNTLKTLDLSQVTIFKTLNTFDLSQVPIYNTLQTFDLSQVTLTSLTHTALEGTKIKNGLQVKESQASIFSLPCLVKGRFESGWISWRSIFGGIANRDFSVFAWSPSLSKL